MGAQRCLPWPGAALDRPGCWSPAGLRGWNADSRHVTRRHLWITEVPDGTQKLHFFVRNRVQNTNGMNVCHVSMCAISFQKSEASPKTHAYIHAERFMCPICSICTRQTRLLHRDSRGSAREAGSRTAGEFADGVDGSWTDDGRIRRTGNESKKIAFRKRF